MPQPSHQLSPRPERQPLPRTGSQPGRQDSASRIFLIFLRLGLTSFGGPVAHLGYFHAEFVRRRRWLGDEAWADLVALCQFLPGPASSKLGFALGLMRGGPAGAVAAFLGFTLPSALLLCGLALTAGSLDSPQISGALHGLKLVAAAIVAQAVLGMAKSLTPDRERAAIAGLAIVILALSPALTGMSLAILAGALAGLALNRGRPAEAAAPAMMIPVRRGAALLALALFLGLLFLLPLAAPLSPGLSLAATFSHAGALVFGGGHVVLPLLEAGTVGQQMVSPGQFLAGYGATQAVPGPLFAFAAWLGALNATGPNGVTGAAIATAAIFLPGFLILIAALPFWNRLRQYRRAQSLMQGANAAVVGILAAALYDPIFTSAVATPLDFAIAALCFIALTAWQAAPWKVVLAGAAAGLLQSLF